MNNKEYGQIKRGSKKRKILKRGQTPKKARVSNKDKTRSFKAKMEALMNG